MRGGRLELFEFVGGKVGLFDDRANRALGEVTGVARYRDAAAVFGVPPDFVAAFGLAVEDEAGATKFAQHVAGGETGETPIRRW